MSIQHYKRKGKDGTKKDKVINFRISLDPFILSFSLLFLFSLIIFFFFAFVALSTSKQHLPGMTKLAPSDAPPSFTPQCHKSPSMTFATAFVIFLLFFFFFVEKAPARGVSADGAGGEAEGRNAAGLVGGGCKVHKRGREKNFFFFMISAFAFVLSRCGVGTLRCWMRLQRGSVRRSARSLPTCWSAAVLAARLRLLLLLLLKR
jgi:hypothetical protein